MLKILLVIAVVAGVYFFFIKKSMPLTQERKAKKKANKVEDETMVECATCGTYITTSEAIVSASTFYCSNECRDKA